MMKKPLHRVLGALAVSPFVITSIFLPRISADPTRLNRAYRKLWREARRNRLLKPESKERHPSPYSESGTDPA